MEKVAARPAWAEGLNERQIEAVLYVGEHGRITNREYQDLNVSKLKVAPIMREVARLEQGGREAEERRGKETRGYS